MTTKETPAQEAAREKAEDRAAEAREDAAKRVAAPPTTPYPGPAPTPALKTQNQKDWEDELARMNAQKKRVVIDTAGAEKLRAEIANQPNSSEEAAAERERLGMIALARAAAMVKKRKHEEEARIKEQNDTVAIS